MPSEDSRPQDDSEREFEQALAEVERSLAELKERYAYARVQQQSAEDVSASLAGELEPLREKLSELKLYLKFMLFNWSEAKEPFWQAVRFGGLGAVIGWLLKSWLG